MVLFFTINYFVASFYQTKKSNPQRELKKGAWHEKGADEWSSSNDTFTNPAEKGTYIFEIIANWEQGNVSYITKLIVE